MQFNKFIRFSLCVIWLCVCVFVCVCVCSYLCSCVYVCVCAQTYVFVNLSQLQSVTIAICHSCVTDGAVTIIDYI